MRFETERFYLRNVRISDATKEYLNWLNASKDNIIRSSENKTLSDLKRFIKKVKSQKDINFKNHTISLGKRNVKLLKSSYVKKKN